MEAQQARLLPVPYFHVVFTLPAEIAELALQNKRELYGLLLRASSLTLQQVAADPRHLGAEIGFVSVLHTWNQVLLHHPHVHCLVPGGGLSFDGDRWIACKSGFFLPVRVLGRVFRGKFLAGLEALHRAGRHRLEGSLARLAEAEALAGRLAKSREQDWVVYAKLPFGGPERVVRYLARYTHRVAISDRRIVGMEGGEVTFAYRDRKHHDRSRTMRIDGVELLRRFLHHALPSGFPKVRHYGVLANRSKKLDRCRELLSVPNRDAGHEPDPRSVAHETRPTDTPNRCAACGSPTLVRREIAPQRGVDGAKPERIDSS